MRKKGLAMLLTLAMLLGMLPTTALAAEPEPKLSVPPIEQFSTSFITASPVDTADVPLSRAARNGGYTNSFGAQLESLLPDALYAGGPTAGKISKQLYDALCNEANLEKLKKGEAVSITVEQLEPYSNSNPAWSSEYNAMLNRYQTYSVNLPGAASNAVAAFDRDRSGIFWLGDMHYSYGTAENGTLMTGSGSFTPTENAVYSIQLEVQFAISASWNAGRNINNDISTVTSAVAERASEANSKSSRYDKLLTVHNWLTQNNEYNSAAANAGSSSDSTPWEAISALTTDQGLQPVCEGYARAFKLICDKLGIPCVLVSGTANSEAHMWNYVQMEDGNWYAVDVTWDDPIVSGGGTGERQTYFLVGGNTPVDDTTTFSQNHTATSDDFLQGKHTAFAYPTLSDSAYEQTTPIAGTVTIDGEPKIGVELTASVTGNNTGNTELKYQWYRGNELIANANGKTYTPEDAADVGQTIKVVVTANGYSGTLEDSTTAKVAKADATAPGSAPTEISHTHNSITVQTVSGQEYACVTGDAPTEDSAWQTSNTFTGLAPNTQYKVYARVAATDTHNASEASPALEITTTAAPINAVTVAVDAPVKNGTPANAADVSESGITVSKVEWLQGDTPFSENQFAGGTAYTVQITLTADEGQSFGNSVNVTLNSESAGNATSSDGKTLVITKTFPATDERTVTGIAVTTQPTKTEYTVGDNFDTAGMVVKATFDDGSEDTDFKDYTIEGGNNLTKGTTSVTIKAGTATETVSITVKGVLTASDFTYTPPTNLTYDGQPKTAKVVYKDGISEEEAGAITIRYSQTDPTTPGTYQVFVTTAGGSDYAAVNQLEIGSFTIAKADQAELRITSTGPVTFGATLTLTTEGGSGTGAVTYAVTNGTGSATISGNVLTPAKAGTVTITATKAADANYNEVASTEAIITINKAEATEAMKTASGTVAAGVAGSVTLPALPDGAVYGIPTTEDAEITALKLKGNQLTYTGGNDVKVDLGYAITIPIAESTNYKAYAITVKLVGSNKITPTLTVNPINVIYTGKDVPASAITGTAKDGDNTVSGTWNWGTGKSVPKNVADSGLYHVFFTPSDSNTYASGTTTVQVTISKATPTGAPKYTEISTSGKTLANAGLTTTGSTFSVPGTVAWTQAASTEVTANTAYQWVFTPTDTANYNTLTGSITLWQRSSSSGSNNGNSGTVSQPSTSGGTSTVTADVNSSTSGSTASASISASTMNTAVDRALNAAKKNGTDPVVAISVDMSSRADSVKVTLPAASLKTLGKNAHASLTVVSDVAEVTLDSDAISAVASQSGSTVTLHVTPVATSQLNSRQKQAVGNAPVFDLSFKSGSTTISDFDGGRVTVTLPYTLKSGQIANGIVVWYMDNSGNLTACNTTYSTSRREVTFTTTHFSKYVIGYETPEQIWINPYYDVYRGAWYYDAVEFVSDKGLMNGTARTRFSPDETTTRAMIVTILWRQSGSPSSSSGTRFSDVDPSQWYGTAVRWAAANNIVTGYGDGMFGPEDAITREQMAAILYRYAQYKGYPVGTTGSLSGYTDANHISNYATMAFRWICGRGIMEGTSMTTLGPAESATRAQVATILMRFCNEYNL